MISLHINHYLIVQSANAHFWIAKDDRFPEFQQMFDDRDSAIEWALKH